MKFFLLVFVLCVTASVAKEVLRHIEYNSMDTLWCDGSDRYIRVTSAELKLDNNQTIPLDELEDLPNIDCTFDFKEKVKHLCDGERTCIINLDSCNFPISSCQKYDKILQLSYECIFCSLDDQKKSGIDGYTSELMPDENDEVKNRTREQSAQWEFCHNLQVTPKEKNIPTKEDCPNDAFLQKHECEYHGEVTNEVLENCAAAKENNRGKSKWISSNTYTLFVSTRGIGFIRMSDICKFVLPVPKYECSKQKGTWTCNFLGNATAHHSTKSGKYFHNFDVMSQSPK